MPQDRGWVRLLERRLKQEHTVASVINASVTGETSAGGRTRIDDALQHHRPCVVIVALGGNDGLRGLPISEMRDNLAYILRAIRRENAKALLVGIKLPPNFGRAYTSRLEAAYQELATEFNVPLVPFLLEGLGTGREYFQADGIHPTAQAQPILLENVWNALAKMVRPGKAGAC